jgi:hypothetical protein
LSSPKSTTPWPSLITSKLYSYKKCTNFSKDSKTIYTKIEATTGVSAIKNYIEANKEQKPVSFPTVMFLKIGISNE